MSVQSSIRVCDGGPRLGWLRVGVLVVVAVASISSLVALPFALGFYADKAREFSALEYGERSFGVWSGVPTAISDRGVVRQAEHTMPGDAMYRVVIGSGWVPSWRSRVSASVEADFLRFYLLPRRQTASDDARWVFCFACDLDQLGTDVRIVAGKAGGLTFVEVVR